MSQNLEFKYAQITLPSGMCVGCFTCSYEINDPEYIAIPELDDYMEKYYNYYGDQMWYWDESFTRLWDECPSHSV